MTPVTSLLLVVCLLNSLTIAYLWLVKLSANRRYAAGLCAGYKDATRELVNKRFVELEQELTNLENDIAHHYHVTSTGKEGADAFLKTGFPEQGEQ